MNFSLAFASPFRAVILSVIVGFCVSLFDIDRAGAQQTVSAAKALDSWLSYTEKLVPRETSGFTVNLSAELAKASSSLEAWAVQVSLYQNARTADDVARTTRQLLDAKRRVDRLIDQVFDLRGRFVKQPVESVSRDQLRYYLRTTARLIDLSGRLRYLLSDALNLVAGRLATTIAQRSQLIDLLIEYRSSIGATATAGFLTDEKSDDVLRAKVLRLIGASGQMALLPQVVNFLDDANVAPELVILAAEVIREVGLPQDPRADTPPELPEPAILASELHERLGLLTPAKLTPDQQRRYSELTRWLDQRMKEGVGDDGYRLGTFDVRPGDWLLMRNPSPYNQFTDLSPGLFTHVGVVTIEQGSDGIRRMVIVDIPEHGNRMPATNVEIFVQRTLHYTFLRHPDRHVAAAMAEAARSIIGNETEFDLNFRNERVLALKGQPLAGRKIRTYCAGVLLLCALQTTARREEFFPIPEEAAGGHTAENLKRMGMTFGEHFISPTGALFSPTLELVGRREPMYDPKREVEEAVFDHFAAQMMDRELSPAVELFDALRLKLAEASQQNPLLAEALAKAAGIGADDLVAAAKAAAVIETLDEVAFAASRRFTEAREALRSGTTTESPSAADYRKRHADLAASLQAGRISPRQMRLSLVKYYIQSGQQEIDRRFFLAMP